MNESGYDARIEGIRYKASADYLQLIEGYVSYLGQQDLLFKDIKFRGEVLTFVPMDKRTILFLRPRFAHTQPHENPCQNNT